MAIHRLNHTFTAGELSPLMNARKDFERYKDGCKVLKNMVCQTQGPATRRPGLQFIYDLAELDMLATDTRVRMIPFIFDEDDAYAMIFFVHDVDGPTVVFASGDGLVLDGASAVVSLTLDATWDIEGFDWAQSADEMNIAQSALSPRVIRRLAHDSWLLVDLESAFTDMPAEWPQDATAPEVAKGWPERVTFHQQRIVYAANISYPRTEWLSKAGDFLDFGVSITLAADDAVTLTLDSGTQNKIQWLQSSKSLHTGTLGDEWTISGAMALNELTPSNISAQRQTNNGSEDNKPLMVGLTVLFIERHGRVVNEFVYDYNYDGYKTSDLAILSPHLTEKYSITDWTYQQTPDSIIWAVRSDGDLLGITYQRQHKVVGWHHHDTDGEFKAITAIPGETREDDVWAVVKRDISGTDVYFIEKFVDMFTGDAASDGHFLDSHAVYDGVPEDEITGLDHLIGATVDVLADGTTHPQVVVDSSGVITLNNEYSYVVVGLPYVSEVRPFLTDVPSDAGTAMGRMQRIINVDIDLYKSLGMILGSYSRENGELTEEVPFRIPTDLTGTEVPLYTGIVHLSFPEGFDRESEYFIRQEQPLPLTVRGVVDTVEVLE